MVNTSVLIPDETRSIDCVIELEVETFPNKSITFNIIASEWYVDWGDGCRSYRDYSHCYTVRSSVIKLLIKGKNIVYFDLVGSRCCIYSIRAFAPTLAGLNCQNNIIDTLYLSECENLKFLHCSNNCIRQLNLSSHSKLTWLFCNHNQIETLDLSACPSLINVDCHKNKIRQLNVKGCIKLRYINACHNEMIISNINHFFRSLPDNSSQSAALFLINGNFGAKACNDKIPRSKGWYILSELTD